MKSRILLVVATLLAILLDVPVATAQATQPPLHPIPPDEHFGIGVFGGPGVPGAVAAGRFSMPATPRVGLDFDVGRVSRSRDYESGRAFGAQVRWLRTARRPNGTSDYGVFGVMHMRETRRSEVRFPGQTIVEFKRVNGVTPVVGYGWDWQSPRGARIGVELTTGGSASAGPRVFAKFFALWGLPSR